MLKTALYFLSFEVYYFTVDEIFPELQRNWQKITFSFFNNKRKNWTIEL